MGEHFGLAVPFGGFLAKEGKGFGDAVGGEMEGVVLEEMESLGGVGIGEDGE